MALKEDVAVEITNAGITLVEELYSKNALFIAGKVLETVLSKKISILPFIVLGKIQIELFPEYEHIIEEDEINTKIREKLAAIKDHLFQLSNRDPVTTKILETLPFDILESKAEVENAGILINKLIEERAK